MNSTAEPVYDLGISPSTHAAYWRIVRGEGLDPESPELHELLAAGLIEQADAGFRAVDLRQAQQRLLARMDTELARLTLMASPLDPPDTPAAAGPGAEYLSDPDDINARLDHEVERAQLEILSTQPQARDAASFRARDRDIAALQRGVEMRTIYPRSACGRTPTRQWVRDMSELGGEYRVLCSPFSRGILIDRRVAFVNDYRFPQEKYAVVIHDPAVIAFLASVFEAAWQRAIGWGASLQEAGTVTTAVQRAILRELIADRTQEAAAHALDMSRSAVEQQLATLRKNLGVQSIYAAIAWFLRSDETDLD